MLRRRSDKPVLVGPLPPPVHGSSIMTELLFSVARDDFACELVNSSSSGALEDVGQLRVRTVTRSLRTVWTTARLLSVRRPFVYLTPSQMGPSLVRDLLLWAMAAARADTVFIHVHGCGFHRLGSTGPRMRRLLVRQLARRSRFILLSERYSAEFLSGIPRPLELSYLPNAISWAAERALTEPPAPASDAAPVVRLLYVGAVTRLKLWEGLHAIVSSTAIAAALGRLDTRLRIVIAGEFHGRNAAEEFRKICAEAGGRIEVDYRGGVFETTAKGRLFASADGFLLPTMHPTEGLPVSLIEALCAGLPIIAFDAGLAGEAVNDQNGWLVSRGDFRGLQESVVRFLECRARDQLRQRRLASRSLYEARFSSEAFQKGLLDILAHAWTSRL